MCCCFFFAIFRPFFSWMADAYVDYDACVWHMKIKKKEGLKMLLKRCRCGALIPQGMKLCEACAAGSGGQQSRHMEYNKYRRNKKTAQFYISAEWRRVRAIALAKYDGLDLYAFYVQKKIATADMVHHIIEIEEDWSKRLDALNLFPLSNANHGIISALYKRDEETKRRTQELLKEILRIHTEGHGGIEKFLPFPD